MDNGRTWSYWKRQKRPVQGETIVWSIFLKAFGF